MKRLTVRQVAERLTISRNAVLNIIRSGQLKAINVSVSPTSMKPRYRVEEGELERFERSRFVGSPVRRTRERQAYERFV